MKKLVLASALVAGLAAGLLLTACNVDSANSTARLVNINVSGVYRNSEADQNGGVFVSRQSGTRTEFLNLRQTGDQLEGVDNNNIVFRGTIGNVIENNASFNLEGSTTAGNRVQISGRIEAASGQGTMRATWIETGLFGNVYGVADGPTVIITNRPPPQTNTNNNSSVSINVPQSEISALKALKNNHQWLTI
ncbi:MAG TPA: hypothetical protein PKE26_14630 [Kiritimatiellia bacterium]|nr:hypothetical protein [Kiritimatiellia bacterium]HMP00336.1 hypothetical protein [Kiritimatiellia bacterium]HMP97345.1 hypothetical protein [Kiritimatiellia bacterium]